MYASARCTVGECSRFSAGWFSASLSKCANVIVLSFGMSQCVGWLYSRFPANMKSACCRFGRFSVYCVFRQGLNASIPAAFLKCVVSRFCSPLMWFWTIPRNAQYGLMGDSPVFGVGSCTMLTIQLRFLAV